MLKFNNSNINDWFYNASDIIKVYHNGAVCYYKIASSGGTQVPCYAVVDDIWQYSDTEFEDVFNKADWKWYKLNNLNQYEEYGVYGDSITSSATTYQGKLSVYNGYEYIYSGSSWVNVGEVSGSSRVPQGYTEVEYLENPNNSFAYINTNFKPNQDTRIVCDMQCVTSSQYGRYIGAGAYNAKNAIQFDYESYYNGTLHISWGHLSSWTTYSNCVGDYNRHIYDWDKNYFYRDKGESNQFSASTTYTSFQCTDNLGIFAYIENGSVNSDTKEHLYGRMYSFQIYDDGTLVRDLVPCKRNSDSLYGAYDIVNDVFYYPPNYSSYPMTGGSATTQVEYPLYYDTIQDPPSAVTFSSMTEAESMECPYVGLDADIDGTDYIFDINYSWVTKYQWVTVPNDYVCISGDKYSKLEKQERNVDDTWTNLGVYSAGTLIESASTDCPSYTEISYIQLTTASSGGGVQLLNTPKEGLLVEIDFQLTGSSSSGDYEIIGQKDNQETVSYQMGFIRYSSWTNGYYDYGGGRLGTYTCPSFTTRRTWKIGRISGSTSPNIVGYYCDGSVNTKSVASLNFDANRPYLIGNVGYNGSSTPIISTRNFVEMKLYSVKIYEDYGATLVGDYIPVLKEDGVTPTLYDKISGNYANAVGAIVAGPTV